MFKTILYIIQKLCMGIILIIIANILLNDIIAYSIFNIIVASTFSVYGIIMLIIVIYVT